MQKAYEIYAARSLLYSLSQVAKEAMRLVTINSIKLSFENMLTSCTEIFMSLPIK
jgi:hypothetical protein